ncbi:hypothetical protein LXL04_025510 [Taraxacum kok-saghyz]
MSGVTDSTSAIAANTHVRVLGYLLHRKNGASMLVDGAFHQDIDTSKSRITPGSKWEQVKANIEVLGDYAQATIKVLQAIQLDPHLCMATQNVALELFKIALLPQVNVKEENTPLKTRDEQKLQVPELRTETATELAILELELPQASPVPIPNIRELPSAIPVPILNNSGTATCRIYKSSRLHFGSATIDPSSSSNRRRQIHHRSFFIFKSALRHFELLLHLQIGDDRSFFIFKSATTDHTYSHADSSRPPSSSFSIFNSHPDGIQPVSTIDSSLIRFNFTDPPSIQVSTIDSRSTIDSIQSSCPQMLANIGSSSSKQFQAVPISFSSGSKNQGTGVGSSSSSSENIRIGSSSSSSWKKRQKPKTQTRFSRTRKLTFKIGIGTGHRNGRRSYLSYTKKPQKLYSFLY